MSHIDSKRHPNLQKVLQGAKWRGQDAYPAWPWVADENEKWLKLIEARVGQDGLNHYVNKLQQEARKRDEFLVELATAYFLDTQCELPIITLEPPGAGAKTGEFLLRLPDERQMFVEVKSPGWEGEVVEEARRQGGDAPRGQPARLARPKYSHLEGRAFHHTQPVRDTVAKAYPKMLDTMPTLLVISDDLFVSLTDGLEMVKWALFAKRTIDPCHEAAQYQPRWMTEDGCFVGSQYERLGAVAIFNFIPENPYRYSFALFRNPNALDAVHVPASPFSRFPCFDSLDPPATTGRRLPLVLAGVGVALLVGLLVWSYRAK